MSKPKRKKLPLALELSLTTQVGGACPRCWKPLFYEKEGKQHKAYEIAHIYPLNPTAEEIALLAAQPMLSTDVNHPDNLIPMCERCHGIFDKPRTVDEYRELFHLKSKFIRASQQIEIRSNYPLEAGVRAIVKALHQHDSALSPAEPLSYDPKSIDLKLNESMSPLTRRKIKHNVSDYFQFIKDQLLALERNEPTASELICAQVRTYYIQQKSLGIPQQEIFSNVTNWLFKKTGSQTIEAAEIVTSFFVQNCEIFE